MADPMSLTRWLRGLPLQNRRTAERRVLPGLVSYFWNGGAPMGQQVREISLTGMFLLTEQSWHPGTVVLMTIQNAASGKTDPGHSIPVQARVVRRNEEGVGLAFVFPEKQSSHRKLNMLRNTADRKTLDTFLRQIVAEVK